jgi:glycosyltransferase involved in cell wall biosynthesis
MATDASRTSLDVMARARARGAKRRVLVVADYYYPRLGGSARVIGESAQALRRLGHDVWIVAGTDDPQLPSHEVLDDVPVLRYRFSPASSLHLNATAIVNGARAVADAIRRHGPFDVVHAHGVFGASGVLLTRAGRATPRVSTFHGPVHREFEVAAAARDFTGRRLRGALEPAFVRLYSRWLRSLQARVIRSAPCVVLSEYAASLAREVAPGAAPSSLRIIPGGADLERFRPGDRAAARARLALPADRPLVLTVRRLEARMGIEDLLDAFVQARRRVSGAHLVVGGKGSLAGRLRDHAGALGARDAVSFPGFVPEGLLPTYYQSADVFVVPSRALEGFGLVTVEALACGTPVVATRVGGSVEILASLDPGLLVDARAPHQLADAIVRTLDVARDPAVRERCRAFVADRYSWALAAERLAALYDEVTAHAR